MLEYSKIKILLKILLSPIVNELRGNFLSKHFLLQVIII